MSIAGSVAVLPVLFQPLQAAAVSSTIPLYSVSASGFLVQVDPASGAETQVVNLLPTGLPIGTTATAGGFTADPKGHRLFGELGIQASPFPPPLPPATPPPPTTQILTVTPSTKTVTTSQGTLSQPLQSALAYDSSTNSLYGITQCCPNELVRIDPGSGVETNVATLAGDTFSSMAINEATHTLYVESSIQTGFPSPPTQLLIVDTTKIDAVSPAGVALGGRGLVFDPSPGTLFGVTFCCLDSFLVAIATTGLNPGAETTIAEITGTLLSGSTATLDPATHTVYVINSTDGASTFVTSINDQGIAPIVTNGAPTLDFLGQLVFLPSSITPDSIKADVTSALSSGAINSSGVATALLAQLDAAAAARTNGDCATAANIYNAFINLLNAQSGQHVAAATATQLVSEAQFLIANCP